MRLSMWSKNNSREIRGIEVAGEVDREAITGDGVVIEGEEEEVVGEGGVEEGANEELVDGDTVSGIWIGLQRCRNNIYDMKHKRSYARAFKLLPEQTQRRRLSKVSWLHAARRRR